MRGGAAAGAAAAIPLFPFLGGKQANVLGGKQANAEASVVPYNADTRVEASFDLQMDAGLADRIDLGIQPYDADTERFTDFSGNYSKALMHDALGVPNMAAVQILTRALRTGVFSDFEKILVGTPRGGPNSRENDPQCALAFDLEGLDSHATALPPAPSVAGAQTAAEQVEHYWAALLRDVSFIEYPMNALVMQAVADLNKLSFARNASNYELPFPVTPQNLFRGQFVPGDGNVQGPYVSQFMLQPASLGAQPLSQHSGRSCPWAVAALTS